jgi:hypothetical protein
MGSSRPFLLAVALAAAAGPPASGLELDAPAYMPEALEAAPLLQIAVVDLRELPREVLRAWSGWGRASASDRRSRATRWRRVTSRWSCCPAARRPS